eukprot:TRINITY_DN5011_c0_g1_i2.p1 TRINITY_DN5011_c0_g1~~TRINITY_DN5011_c0_g1_i2.p1  ORF type:complete len:633 (-),score=167.22 TRINITY_DN5011_c0_g1_i2:39-1667(-)
MRFIELLLRGEYEEAKKTLSEDMNLRKEEIVMFNHYYSKAADNINFRDEIKWGEESFQRSRFIFRFRSVIHSIVGDRNTLKPIHQLNLDLMKPYFKEKVQVNCNEIEERMDEIIVNNSSLSSLNNGNNKEEKTSSNEDNSSPQTFTLVPIESSQLGEKKTAEIEEMIEEGIDEDEEENNSKDITDHQERRNLREQRNAHLVSLVKQLAPSKDKAMSVHELMSNEGLRNFWFETAYTATDKKGIDGFHMWLKSEARIRKTIKKTNGLFYHYSPDDKSVIAERDKMKKLKEKMDSEMIEIVSKEAPDCENAKPIWYLWDEVIKDIWLNKYRKAKGCFLSWLQKCDSIGTVQIDGEVRYFLDLSGNVKEKIVVRRWKPNDRPTLISLITRAASSEEQAKTPRQLFFSLNGEFQKFWINSSGRGQLSFEEEIGKLSAWLNTSFNTIGRIGKRKIEGELHFWGITKNPSKGVIEEKRSYRKKKSRPKGKKPKRTIVESYPKLEGSSFTQSKDSSRDEDDVPLTQLAKRIKPSPLRDHLEKVKSEMSV